MRLLPSSIAKPALVAVLSDRWHDFWRQLREFLKLLLPISKVIAMVQSEECTLADIMRFWLYLAKDLVGVMAASKLAAEYISHAAAQYIRRMQALHLDLHRLALFLDPTHKLVGASGGDKNKFKAIADAAANVMHIRRFGAQELIKLIQQMRAYRSGVAPFDVTCEGGGRSAVRAWWIQIGQSPGGNIIFQLAIVLLDAVPHAAAPERAFNLLGWLQSERRNRINAATMGALATIKVRHIQEEGPRFLAKARNKLPPPKKARTLAAAAPPDGDVFLDGDDKESRENASGTVSSAIPFEAAEGPDGDPDADVLGEEDLAELFTVFDPCIVRADLERGRAG
ncbi:unnamed protein product [Phaeothamnion confervicola]